MVSSRIYMYQIIGTSTLDNLAALKDVSDVIVLIFAFFVTIQPLNFSVMANATTNVLRMQNISNNTPHITIIPSIWPTCVMRRVLQITLIRKKTFRQTLISLYYAKNVSKVAKSANRIALTNALSALQFGFFSKGLVCHSVLIPILAQETRCSTLSCFSKRTTQTTLVHRPVSLNMRAARRTSRSKL
jgi:hypothetical protein